MRRGSLVLRGLTGTLPRRSGSPSLSQFVTNDDGQPMKRLLIWETEEESIDDPGVHSVAYLTIIGRA